MVVGPNRMRAAMEDPEHVVERIKRHMGNVEYKRTFDGREITPEFLSALILKKLRQDARKADRPDRQRRDHGAVLLQRCAAQGDAGRRPHCRPERRSTSSTSRRRPRSLTPGSAASWGPCPERPSDRGWRWFTIWAAARSTSPWSRYTPTHFQVLATDGDVHLGGVDWNDRLLDHVAEEFKAKHGSDPRDSAGTTQVLRNDCDLAKIALSGRHADLDRLPARGQEQFASRSLATSSSR